MAHFFFLTFISLLTVHLSQAQIPCAMPSVVTFGNQYDNCIELPHLDSNLEWSHDASENTLSISFTAHPATSTGWISWAINPTGNGMAGAQALVAFKAHNGSMVVKTFNISSYSTITEGKLAFKVLDMSADYIDGEMRIIATVELPEKGMKSVNHVWQVGPSVSPGGFPAKHAFQPANLGAKGRLDLSSEQSSSDDSMTFDNGSGTNGDSRTKKRNIHGILNAVSWGILFPVGVIIARYLRTFPAADPTWFYLHAFCQVSAYAIGVAGWATGLKLGSESKGVTFNTHRNIGITLFSLATVQIFALFLRPDKDHKFRFYWNIYHHGVGYSILVLGILNVFKGLDILSPESNWRSAYVITISTLGAIALLLEVITWIVILKRKSSKSTKPYDNKQQSLAP